VEELVTIAEKLESPPHEVKDARRFFLSYCHANADVADQVEAYLLREGRQVFRDEKGLQLGDEVDTTLVAAINAADVFIALYSRDYATSSSCFDELEEAFKQFESRSLRMWIIQLDDTPIVPRRVREARFLRATASTRAELRAHLDSALRHRPSSDT
jgi:hypothetical protein